MEPEQRKKVQETIEAAIATTEQDIASLKELTKPVEPDVAIGRLSRMDAIGNKSINEAALNTAMNKHGRLRYALTQIDSPEFGICRECGEPIPVGRIMIVPESAYCVQCAE